MEDCRRTTEDCRRAAKRIEEEVAYVSLFDARLSLFCAAAMMCSIKHMARWPIQLCRRLILSKAQLSGHELGSGTGRVFPTVSGRDSFSTKTHSWSLSRPGCEVHGRYRCSSSACAGQREDWMRVSNQRGRCDPYERGYCSA